MGGFVFYEVLVMGCGFRDWSSRFFSLKLAAERSEFVSRELVFLFSFTVAVCRGRDGILLFLYLVV